MASTTSNDLHRVKSDVTRQNSRGTTGEARSNVASQLHNHSNGNY